MTASAVLDKAAIYPVSRFALAGAAKRCIVMRIDIFD